MKELVLFSLRRRFFNQTTKVLFILLAALFTFGFFFDFIVEFFAPSKSEQSINLINIDQEEFLINQTYFVYDKNADLTIEHKDHEFVITSPDFLSENEQIQIESLIYPYYQESLPMEIQSVLLNYRHPILSYKQLSSDHTLMKHDHLFIVITMIYFMMIGFAGMLAQEVVAEKTSNILEMIGTSVSLKTHYYSKIIIGWCSIIGQFVLVGSVFVVIGGLRLIVDNGKGLLSYLQKFGIVSESMTSFTQLISNFFSNSGAITDLLLSLGFLFIGLLMIQLILVVVSTKVNTVEEAGALQNPFYIGLLFMYYGAMILNNPASMTTGYGFYLSFVPIFSMIFMPSRLMLYSVGLFQILIAYTVNIIVLVIIIYVGQNIYGRNVLNTVRKPKAEKRTLFQKFKTSN